MSIDKTKIWLQKRSAAMQSGMLGERFVGASLSDAEVNEREGILLNEFLEKPAGTLYVCGPAGVGKTHLAASLIDYFAPSMPEIRAYHETEIFGKLRQAISSGSIDYSEVLKYMIDYELIIIDDIGTSNISDWKCEVMFDLVNIRYNSRRPTVYTSNLSPQELCDAYGVRISSRIFGYPSIVMDFSEYPSWRSKA